MSNTKVVMSQASNQYVAPTFIEDVFSTYLYTGNGSTQTITNGIDLAGEGGLVWAKSRGQTYNHHLMDTENGATNFLKSNSTDFIRFSANVISSFNSDGFTIGGGGQINESSDRLASWTFRKAPRFFDVVTYTGTGSAQTIAHNLGVAPGMIVAKQTSASGQEWNVYHRSLGYTKYFYLSDVTAAATYAGVWQAEPTSTSFSVGDDSGTNANGQTYVAYLFAHDPLGPSGDGSDGLIDCGSYNGGVPVREVNLGFEPQWVLIKNVAVSGANWVLVDNMRGASETNNKFIAPNTSGAEVSEGPAVTFKPTGFNANGGYTWHVNDQTSPSSEYIYIAIRRGPMRAPESGTEVFGSVAAGSNGITTNFVTDFGFLGTRAGADKYYWSSRLTGTEYLNSANTAAGLTAPFIVWDRMDGFWDNDLSGFTYHGWGFRRAPEFFDVVAYTGDSTAGRTVSHNLGVAPEMMIVKSRGDNESWCVYHAGVPTPEQNYLYLNENSTLNPNANTIRYWNHTLPASTEFTLGNEDRVNQLADTYIAYLFATLAGVSKVGSYTGNGSSQTIDCGFTTGARFILIKRTDSTGDWYVWDTARGIVAGNDPFLELNTTAAEVTTDDSIDPDSSGFIVNQTAVTDVNVNAASYIFYAVA